jgi:hypothetical protein
MKVSVKICGVRKDFDIAPPCEFEVSTPGDKKEGTISQNGDIDIKKSNDPPPTA